MEIIVDVTEEDIAKSARKCPTQCAIAICLKRQFPDSNVCVMNGYDNQSGLWYTITIRGKKYGICLSFDLPYEYCKLIKLYDGGEKLEPFSFVVTL